MHNLPFMGAGTEAAFDDYGIPPSRYSLVPWWGKSSLYRWRYKPPTA